MGDNMTPRGAQTGRTEFYHIYSIRIRPKSEPIRRCSVIFRCISPWRASPGSGGRRVVFGQHGPMGVLSPYLYSLKSLIAAGL